MTQKASEKVTERVLRRETLKVNRQTEETNQHTFDNRTGTAHISGIYQWVTKVYEVQVYNYGPRTVYDIMIPDATVDEKPASIASFYNGLFDLWLAANRSAPKLRRRPTRDRRAGNSLRAWVCEGWRMPMNY